MHRESITLSHGGIKREHIVYITSMSRNWEWIYGKKFTDNNSEKLPSDMPMAKYASLSRGKEQKF